MTSEEIVRTLRKCVREDCTNCSLNGDWRHCHDCLSIEAADLIERLEKEKAALLGYAKKSAGCEQCKHDGPQCDAVCCVACKKECACVGCKKGSKWEWKGVDAE